MHPHSTIKLKTMRHIFILITLLISMLGCDQSQQEMPPEELTIPKGMVYVPSGEVTIGNSDGLPNERDGYRTTIKAFLMDKHPVTVAQFRAFVEATGYQTDAEKFGDAAVLNDTTKTWELRRGAYWAFPQGKQQPPAPETHPVTQVSWNDAQAYCQWAKKRLPTEAEWEHAAKNAQDIKTLFPWGNEQKVNGVYKANFWQGSFPYINQVKDEYAFTNPVGAFGETPLGLTDMVGNVWEWCADWYRPYAEREQPFVSNKQSEKVQRGGSFLCDLEVCYGFRTTARSHSTPESALYNVGFRAVKDVE